MRNLRRTCSSGRDDNIFLFPKQNKKPLRLRLWQQQASFLRNIFLSFFFAGPALTRSIAAPLSQSPKSFLSKFLMSERGTNICFLLIFFPPFWWTGAFGGGLHPARPDGRQLVQHVHVHQPLDSREVVVHGFQQQHGLSVSVTAAKRNDK